MSAETYEVPDLPFEAIKREESDFMIDFENWTFLNHGAFGGALRCGFDRANQWRKHLENQPLRYHDRELLPHLAYSTRRLATFMNLDRRHITLLPNVTSGINSILSSYCRKETDSHIVTWDTTYGSVKKMSAFYSEHTSEIPFQAQYLEDYSLAHDPTQGILQSLRDHLHTTKIETARPILIVDHTTSNTALTIPFNDVATEFKKIYPEGLVVVDGAHGLLAQDICVSDDVDFYLSNGHKWLSCPRGVAMMYAKPAHHQWLYPSVLSHGMDEPDFLSRFVWDGCRDYAAALALPVVLDHWEAIGPETIRQRMRDQLINGLRIVVSYLYPELADDAASWSGSVTLASTSSAALSPMALLKISKKGGKTSSNAKMIQDLLYEECIEVPIKCINEELFVRVSCHVYNTDAEFERLGIALANMQAKGIIG